MTRWASEQTVKVLCDTPEDKLQSKLDICTAGGGLRAYEKRAQRICHAGSLQQAILCLY